MKIKSNLYGLVYKNHDGKFTKKPYGGLTWRSIGAAKYWSENFSTTKKNMRVVRLTLETVN